MFGRVAREVNKDVDAVLANSLCQCSVRQTGNRVPVRQIPSQALGDTVCDGVVVVCVQR